MELESSAITLRCVLAVHQREIRNVCVCVCVQVCVLELKREKC